MRFKIIAEATRDLRTGISNTARIEVCRLLKSLNFEYRESIYRFRDTVMGSSQ